MPGEDDERVLLDEKYRVVRVLGEGAFGQVLLANDELIGHRQVAIKVLRDPGRDGSMLVSEMQALARLAHPGVVAFHHHFEQFRKLHLVMEYCEGGSLRPVVDAAPIPLATAIETAKDVARTLQVVHDHAIVHHDIKPENLLYGTGGRLKVGDFGVANRIAGTAVYMAPELFLPTPALPKDVRVDIYALGITLLEMVLGDLPFWKLGREETLQSKLRQDFVPSTLPEWLQEVLLRATHPTPELRFQSMQDLAEALETRHVPYVFDRDRLKAQIMADKAEKLLEKRKWRQASRCIEQSFALSADCVAAHLAAGRLALMLRRIQDADHHLAEALRLNPRAHIQKDLGWIAAEKGDNAKAISLLTDHLQREAADFEAYNLLLMCFYNAGQFEAGEDIARLAMEHEAPSDCFRNNRFLCRLLRGGYRRGALEAEKSESVNNPFIAFNLHVATETPKSWDSDGRVPLKSKLLFQDYRFGLRTSGAGRNELTVKTLERETTATEAVLTLGSLETNDFQLKDPSVSRRHAVFINFPADVWIVDLGSARGTHVDGAKLARRMHLDGVHDVMLGAAKLRVTSRSGLLV